MGGERHDEKQPGLEKKVAKFATGKWRVLRESR
jgi:hypothetical protein